MKILLVSMPFDCAGGKILLSKGINKYTKHFCRLLTTGQNYMKFENDIIFNNNNSKLLSIIEKSDVLVFFMQDYSFNIGNLDWREHLQGKRILFNGQCSPWLRGNWRNDLVAKNQLFNYYAKTTVQPFNFKAPLFYKNEKWMPVYIPIYDKEYSPEEKSFEGKIIIGQSPSESARKDTDIFVSAFKKLRKKHRNIEMDIVTGVDNKTCLKRKRGWHIAFDNISDGYEGKSGWESLSMGIPTLTGMNKAQEGTLRIWGRAPQPFHLVEDEKSLYYGIDYFLSNREKLSKASHDSRFWMQYYCHPQRVIGRFIDIVEETALWA